MKQYIITAFIGISAGLGGSFLFYNFAPEKTNVYQTRETLAGIQNTNAAILEPTAINENFTFASEASTKCVVYIKTTIENQYDQSNWFDFYFNGRNSKTICSGSGVIFSPNGYIITNNHVIENATKIEVVYEKKTYTAKIIGHDPSTDIAVLKIEATDLPPIKVGDSRELKIGEWVLAVGNPFNLTSTVTAGIVSAKGRSLNIVNSRFPIESFIQTDAAINPGNSGGALVNLKGELVGINTAILSKTGSYTGYGFAVPVDIVKKIVNDIIKFGEVQKAFFGAEVTEINTRIAKQYNLKDLAGVIVTNVLLEGSAKKSGIEKGDVLLKINNNTIDSKNNFKEIISTLSPGDKINIIFKRNGSIKKATLILFNREGTTTHLKREIYKSDLLGADLEKVSKIEKNKLGIEEGIKIVNIREGLFQQLGMQEGFIITKINGVKATNPEEISNILANTRGRMVIEGVNESGTKGYYSYYY